MLAIIPARGGSKGLPGKNIRPLNGKPLIAYAIEAALGAKEIDRVVISTDSDEIASVSKKYGAEVPFMRPPDLAQDNSLAIDNYIYTIDRLSRESGNNIENVVVLLPTAPLRNSMDIDNAIKLFREKHADSVISYYPAPHPVQWHRYIDENGVLRSFFGDNTRLANRQDEKETYLPNGAIYVFKYSILKNLRVYYTDRTYPYIMPANRSVDIDTIDDFCRAEFLLNSNSVRNSGKCLSVAKSSEIRTKRLLIVPFSEKYLHETYVGWLNDAELMRYSEQRHKKHDLEECRLYWRSFEGTPNYFWAIEEINAGIGHIGNITAFVNEKNLIADVGIMIGAREAQNKHYGIEAWMGVCNYLFNNLPIRKVTAGTLSVNTPMLKIMNRAGMIEDGIRHKHFLFEGQEVDIIHKALFREQWERVVKSSQFLIQ